jgi:hypothetical protein
LHGCDKEEDTLIMENINGLSDRDILMLTHSDVQHLKDDVKAFMDVTNTHIANLDARTTANERFIWKVIGGLAALVPIAAFIGGVANAWFNKLLS